MDDREKFIHKIKVGTLRSEIQEGGITDQERLGKVRKLDEYDEKEQTRRYNYLLNSSGYDTIEEIQGKEQYHGDEER